MTAIAFINANSYFPRHEVQYLGDGGKENDPVQPALAFSFGRQPRATRDADKGQVKVGMIGAGDVAEKFILPVLRQRGTEIYIVDPKIPQYLKQNLNQETEHYIHTQIGDNSSAVLPDDLSYILILTLGHYERFGKESQEPNPTGEIYGRGEIMMGIEGGRQDIKTTIEAAKGARGNDGMIELKDSKGRVLRWEMFPEGGVGSHVEMRVKEGIVAKAWMEADCYSLVFESITRFVKEGEPVALYYQEQAATFRGITAMHEYARSQEIPAGEIITQLKIQETHL